MLLQHRSYDVIAKGLGLGVICCNIKNECRGNVLYVRKEEPRRFFVSSHSDRRSEASFISRRVEERIAPHAMQQRLAASETMQNTPTHLRRMYSILNSI